MKKVYKYCKIGATEDDDRVSVNNLSQNNLQNCGVQVMV